MGKCGRTGSHKAGVGLSNHSTYNFRSRARAMIPPEEFKKLIIVTFASNNVLSNFCYNKHVVLEDISKVGPGNIDS